MVAMLLALLIKLGWANFPSAYRSAEIPWETYGSYASRFMQETLGHASVSTTQICTQVSIRHLKQIHTATHPAAALLARLAQEAERKQAL